MNVARRVWVGARIRRRLALAILTATLTGCTAGDSSPPLLVLAASDLQVAFEEFVPIFEERTGEPVNLVLGSTGNLSAQIRHGAPGDLFFAANESFIDDLVAAGRIKPGSKRLYAVGRLVLVAPPGRSPAAGLASLTDPEVRIVAIANPEHAPYGMAARDALLRAGLWDAVQPRLVLGENVAQTYQLVRTGNADAGIVALGLVMGIPGGPIPFTLVDAGLHPPLRQAAGIVEGSLRSDLAQGFLDLVLSSEGQQILARHGFEAPE